MAHKGPTITKTCEDCGREYKTLRENAKKCRLCRLLSQTIYWHGKTRECVACEAKFAPLESHRDDGFCGECMVRLKSWHSVEGTCAFCGTHTPYLLGEDVRVCNRCARDPEKRGTFIKSLRNKQLAVSVKDEVR